MSDYTRKHFRVRYPVGDRPKITVAGSEGSVLNLSENGVQFVSAGSCDADRGETLCARIEFSGGNQMEVRGKVVIIQGQSFALELDTPLPLGLMMAEHRFLIQKYPEALE